MRTTARQVTYKIREHILGYFADWQNYDFCDSSTEALKSQIDHMKHLGETDYQTAKRLVEGGQFLIYHYDVNNFMNDLDINDKKKDYTDEQTWELYIHLLAREICKLIN